MSASFSDLLLPADSFSFRLANGASCGWRNRSGEFSLVKNIKNLWRISLREAHHTFFKNPKAYQHISMLCDPLWKKEAPDFTTRQQAVDFISKVFQTVLSQEDFSKIDFRLKREHKSEYSLTSSFYPVCKENMGWTPFWVKGRNNSWSVPWLDSVSLKDIVFSQSPKFFWTDNSDKVLFATKGKVLQHFMGCLKIWLPYFYQYYYEESCEYLKDRDFLLNLNDPKLDILYYQESVERCWWLNFVKPDVDLSVIFG